MLRLELRGVLLCCKRSLASRVALRDALQLQASGEAEEVTVTGWVTSVRRMGKTTFLHLSDGSSQQPMQLVAPVLSIPEAEAVKRGCSVLARGGMVGSRGPGQRVEMLVNHLQVLGDCDSTTYPFSGKQSYSSEYLRGYLHLRTRTEEFRSLLRIRHSATRAISDFFHRNGFLHCHTPVLSSSDCEGAGEVFEVKASGEDDFFQQKTFLTVSGQLHAEALMSGMTSVYTFGPTFRAEKSRRNRRHLAEFYMVEAETLTPSDMEEGLEALMRLIQELLTSIIAAVEDSNPEEMDFFRKEAAESRIPTLHKDLGSTSFQRLPYSEAIELLQRSGQAFEMEPMWGDNLHAEHEQYLVDHCGQRPLFVTDFPAITKPFYTKWNESSDRQTAASLDLLVPGAGEIVGGTIREDRHDVLRDRLESEGKLEQYQWYLDLRQFGSVPHGGFGLGFERLLQAMLGINNIKDVIPFPRYYGSCQT